MSDAHALDARNIRVARRSGWTLDVPELSLTRGETLALLGPNGAGKSTLLHVLALLERPSRGSLLLDGTPVRYGDVRARRRMAVALQEPLLIDADVRTNVTLGMKLHGVAKTERERRASLWMERTGIAHLARQRARTLSGGEARRVSLARALALQPLALFLDEPFAALDAPTHRSLLAELPGWLRAAGCATVLVSHDRDDALRLADRVAVMIDGRVRQIGPVTDVFSRPVDPDVAEFVGVENVLTGIAVVAHNGVPRVTVGSVLLTVAESVPEGDVLVMIHPDHVLLAAATPPQTSARNILPATVLSVEPTGASLRVTLDVGFPLVATLTRASVEELGVGPGVRVTALVKASAVHVVGRGS